MSLPKNSFQLASADLSLGFSWWFTTEFSLFRNVRALSWHLLLLGVLILPMGFSNWNSSCQKFSCDKSMHYSSYNTMSCNLIC